MPIFVKLPCCTINLSQIRLIEFEFEPLIAVITWAGGEEATLLRGCDALALMEAIEHLKYFIDTSAYVKEENLLFDS
ncbi:hypothetical protein COO91_01482 [Nostoc flagelliforme CCNUN1]|jgi:hypothetical protein|uniref:Uncharacterized protein n=1 Tax=Nostoc flagelliforme CCNUN1 TaxID=2038116 RepID=A0A2K8SJI2_9NOSO|nr:hypothetical protein [Nostoc flagelliforme]AUB35592.1 hypothetical protein COO91_01482 [Nostoc flagelliforme CCNUN1]